MKKIILNYTLISLLCVSIFPSCTKDFNALPGNQITEENLYQSEEGFKAATNGLYATLQSPTYYGGTMITITELYTPYNLTGGYDDATLTNIGEAAKDATTEILLEATNPRIRNIWVSIYNTIRACNIFLSQGANGKPSVITDETVWNNLKGQALGIRALAHFDLLRLFGEFWNTGSEFGIPVMITVPQTTDKPARNTVNETYTQIIKDLDDALTLLSDNNATNPIVAPGAGKNYIDATVINALKARVLLYKGDKANAITLAQKVIDNSKISLTTDLVKYYATRSGNEESIFELSFSNQNPSKLNLTTYKNETAFVNDLISGIDTSILYPYLKQTGDIDLDKYLMVNDGITSDRTLKYASLPSLQNNPAYIIRLSEMYLILAEANNFDTTKLSALRIARGSTNSTTTPTAEGIFAEIIAELNFEGAHTMCARARLNIDGFKDNGKGIFPIPQAELLANGNMKQNPHY